VSEYLAWVRLRSAWVTLGFLWLLFLYDASGRVFVARDATLRKFDAPAVPAAPALVSAARVEQALKDWFPVPVTAQAAAQKKLGLQAVLGANGKLRAVIAVMSAEGVFETRRVVALGEDIEGWKLTNIERASVTLVRDSEAEPKVLKMFPSRAGATQ
jgi:hypothetical protein